MWAVCCVVKDNIYQTTSSGGNIKLLNPSIICRIRVYTRSATSRGRHGIAHLRREATLPTFLRAVSEVWRARASTVSSGIRYLVTTSNKEASHACIYVNAAAKTSLQFDAIYFEVMKIRSSHLPIVLANKYLSLIEPYLKKLRFVRYSSKLLYALIN